MFRRYIFRLITFAIFVTIGLLTLPEPLWLAEAGLDPSWVLGLHLAAANGFIFGKDIISTYGPLGYLNFPLCVNIDLWRSAVLFTDVVHIAFFISIAAVVLLNESRLLSGLTLGLSAPLITSFLDTPYTLGALFVIASYFVAAGRQAFKYLFFLAFATAVTFYVKADLGALTFATLLMTTVWVYSKEQSLKIFLPLLTFFGSLVAIGVALVKNLNVFISFLVGYFNTVIGYGGAMSIEQAPFPMVLFPILFSFAFLLLIIKSRENSMRFLFVALPYLFITFKHGFVREDQAHLFTFFGGWSLFCLLILGLQKTRNRQLSVLFLAALILFSGVAVASGSGLSGLVLPQIAISGPQQVLNFITNVYHPSQTGHVIQTVDLLLNPAKGQASFNNSILSLRHAYSLSNRTLAMLQGHSVDVLPWDVALVYAYGLRWNPAPSFQSFSTYTTYLDSMNSLHYEGSDAPEFILFSFKSIDGRYPFFDEPRTFRNIMTNYESVSIDGEYIILKHKMKNCTTLSEILVLQGKTGEVISFPINNGKYLFGNITLSKSLIGQLFEIGYKTSPAYTQFILEDGNVSPKYRIILDTAKDGVYLSQFAENTHDSSFILQEQKTRRIVGILITVTSPRLYNEKITISLESLNCR